MKTEPIDEPSRRVLIVEDEPRLRDVLRRAVREMEFIVDAAPSAEAAVACLEAAPHDIVVVDLNLPGMHGLELCALVRSRWPTTQLIILTGYGDLDAAKAAMRLDVVDFLTKPCALSDLEVALDRALRRRRHHIVARVEDEAIPADAVGAEEAATLDEIERRHILDALARHDGNRARAAEELGISVRTLYYRLSAYEKQGHYSRERNGS
jgi:DNA-binding NtrC family response regulator